MKWTPQKTIVALVTCVAAGQLQAVAGEVGQLLDLTVLVIMGEDRGILAHLQRLDLVVERDRVVRCLGMNNATHRQGFLVFYVAQE